MATPSLDQRLAGMMGEPAPTPVPEMMPLENLEPMPAEMVAEPSVMDEPDVLTGTPNMEEGVDVAISPGAIVRGLMRKGGSKAERALVPGAEDASKAGRYVVIPEATPQTAAKVEQAVQARVVAGKPTGVPPEEAFNLSRFQTEDAAQIVAGVSDALGIKTEKVTFEQIRLKAAESGIDEHFLSRLVGNDGKMMANAVDTYKALQVLEASATELDTLFKKVASAQATDADKLKLRQQIAFHGLLQKGVKGMQTETARALAVFRVPRDNTDAIRQVLDQFGGDEALSDMARSYLTLETRAAKNALVEKSMMSGVKDIWFTTYINGLLSSPVSHAKNIVGNAAFGLYQIPERLIASIYSNVLPPGVRSWKALVPGSEKEKIEFDEALTMIQSLRNGVLDGLQLASKAWKTNQPNDLMSKIEDTRGLREGMGEQLQRITGTDPETWMGKAMDLYGTAITAPGRALMTEDEFFKGVFYRMELEAQILRRGKKVYRDSIEAGMPEADALAKMEAEVQSLFASPPADLDALAVEYAQRGTFTNELPEGLRKLQQTFNHPAAKVVVPFFKTPANIGLNVIERTPFAPISSRFREEMAKGGVYRDMALAKVTMGSALLGTFGAIAAEGGMTGSGPTRKSEREALMRDGWQPYSFKIGDKYYSYAGLEPMSAFLGMAADYAEYAQREDDDSKIEEVFLGLTIGFAEYMKEQPYLQGIADIAGLLGMGKGQQDVDIERVINGLSKQFGGFVIGGSPAGGYSSMIAAIERLNNPTASDTRASPDLPMGVRGAVEAFNQYKSRLPYFNESLPESLNLWGDPIQRGQGKLYEMVLPTRVSSVQFSMVDDMLQRLGGPIGMPDRKVQGIELSATQYNQLLTIYGKELMAKEVLGGFMADTGFEFLPLDEQQKAVQGVHSQLMDAARQTLIQRDPELAQKIMELTENRKAQGLFYKPD